MFCGGPNSGVQAHLFTRELYYKDTGKVKGKIGALRAGRCDECAVEILRSSLPDALRMTMGGSGGIEDERGRKWGALRMTAIGGAGC